MKLLGVISYSEPECVIINMDDSAQGGGRKSSEVGKKLNDIDGGMVACPNGIVEYGLLFIERTNCFKKLK